MIAENKKEKEKENMKYKALFLSLLMLLGPALVFLPKPTQAAVGGPVIWVNPADSKFWAPCQVSKTFNVEVKLWNKMDLTQKNIYAFDFSIGWWNSTFGMDCPHGYPVTNQKTSMISLKGVVITSPWKDYFIVKNETIHHGTPLESDPGWDEYHLAITALDASAPLTDVQAVLVTLTFHIDSEPCYPDTWTNIFQFEHVLLSDNASLPVIPSEVDNGHFYLYSSPPDAHLKPDATTLPVNPDTDLPYIMDYKVGDEYVFDVYMSNMSRVYGFEFYVCFNPDYLFASTQCVTIGDLFPAPYSLYLVDVGTPGYLHVKVLRNYDEKPLISCATDVKVASFCLTTDAPEAYPTLTNYMLPAKANTTVTLQWAAQYAYQCKHEVVYYPQGTPFDLKLENTTIEYMWRPNPVDLNVDGVVDIADLSALAKVYGKTKGWGA